MKFTVQIFGGNLEHLPDLLMKIASEIREGKTCENHFEENCRYSYCLEEESYHRKFMVYSTDHVSTPSTDPKI